jgi:AcrR family transcriptional regulator
MGEVSRKRLNAAARRESILEAAKDRFVSIGYDRTRVADIADRLDVTEPVVFQNFGTKAQLFHAVLERAAEELSHHVALLAERGATAHEVLGRMLAMDQLERIHTNGGLGLLFADAAGAEAHTAQHSVTHPGFTRLVTVVTDLMRRGQADGSIRRDIPPETLTWLALSLVHGWAFRRSHARPSPALERDLMSAGLQIFRPVQ